MATKLDKELTAAGWKRNPEDFREIVVNAFKRHFPGWTDEQVLCRPRDSMHLCNLVRQLSLLNDLPDDVILRTLTNVRKRG